MRTLFAILAAFAMTVQAGTRDGTDYSDLWFNPSESGWGLNLSQQNEIIFATLFHYAANGQPTWYVGPDVRFISQTGTTLNFSGPWYQTTGPAFSSGFFNPNAVGVRQVGNITLAFSSVIGGTVSFTADGVGFNKTITRQTFRNNNPVANYVGGTTGTFSGCTSGNGLFEAPVLLSFTSTSASLSFSEIAPNYTCNYGGSYAQFGRMGASNGTFSCNNSSGTYQLFEVETTLSGITARLELAQGGACRFVGRIGGIRRAP